MFLPGLWKIANWRVRRYSAEGRYREAAGAAAWYVRLRPQDLEGWTDLGDSLLAAGDSEAAAEAMRRGLGRYPNHPRLTYLLAMALLRQGELDRAEPLLQGPWSAFAEEAFFADLGRVQIAVSRGDPVRAVEIAHEAAKRIPHGWPWAKFELAESLLPISAGRSLAERLLSEAATELPHRQTRYALTHLYLGALIEARDPNSAAAHFREAQANWRSHPDRDRRLKATRDLLAREQ